MNISKQSLLEALGYEYEVEYSCTLIEDENGQKRCVHQKKKGSEAKASDPPESFPVELTYAVSRVRLAGCYERDLT